MPTPTPTPTPPTFNANPPCSSENIGTVKMVFVARQCAGNPGDNYPTHYVSTVTVGPGLAVETFKSTALAYYSAPGGDPTNKANLDNLAGRFAYDWLSWRQTQYDQVMAGVAAVAPCGLHEDIEWDLSSDRHATRIYTAPHNFHVQETGHFDWDGDNTCNQSEQAAPSGVQNATPCVLFYGPPAKCNNGHLQMTRYKGCLEDGRLVQRFVSTDDVT